MAEPTDGWDSVVDAIKETDSLDEFMRQLNESNSDSVGHWIEELCIANDMTIPMDSQERISGDVYAAVIAPKGYQQLREEYEANPMMTFNLPD